MREKAHPLWTIWVNMRRRCYYEKHPDYKRYGARGITYDPAWNKFKTFLADMEASYEKGLTLDRIDNDGPYCKANCRWLSIRDNNRNRSSTKLTLEKAREIRIKLAAGRRVQSLADEYGVSVPLICAVRKGQAWYE